MGVDPTHSVTSSPKNLFASSSTTLDMDRLFATQYSLSLSKVAPEILMLRRVCFFFAIFSLEGNRMVRGPLGKRLGVTALRVRVPCLPLLARRPGPVTALVL